MGGKTIAVSSWDNDEQMAFTFRKKDGVDLKELTSITDAFGGIEKEKARDLGYEVLDGEAWLEQEVDILVPAALENQITAENAGKIHARVKILAEGANGPTTPEADQVLAAHSLVILPDFLTNAGGVVCSYFEQVQSNMNYYWEKDEVLSKIDVKMTAAYAGVGDFSKVHNLSMREAAYVISVNRVAQACHDRGWV